VAAERGIGVQVNMPLEKARLHKIVAGRPLPGFAAEFDAANWAQFFLKWVISNPAVTCALPSTSNPAHAVENMGALVGRLPTPAMRRRMVAHMETIPGFSGIANMPWYPDKNYPGTIRGAQAAIRARAS
jgi:diketogulonate reductase-like aldo/keto reductase